MPGLGTLLLWIAMPAAGSLAAGVLAEFVSVSNRTLSLLLHAVAGMLLGVVGIELMPRALEAQRPWLVILLFGAGGLFTIALDRLTQLAQRLGREAPEEEREKRENERKRETEQEEERERTEGDAGAEDVERRGENPENGEEAGAQGGGGGGARKGPWVIFLGVGVDLLTDGLLMVSGANVAQGLGLLLALALLAADSLEAFATSATLKYEGARRRTRLLIAASYPVLLFGGALLGHFTLRGAPEIVQLGVLAFTGGILLTLVIEEIIPQSHEKWEGELATLMLIGGFMLFAFLSSYVA